MPAQNGRRARAMMIHNHLKSLNYGDDFSDAVKVLTYLYA
jgi:hypothetical protein